MRHDFEEYVVTWELHVLEKKADSFTLDVIELIEQLYQKGKTGWAKQIEETALFAWYIMNTSNGWYAEALDSEWTTDEKEQQDGIAWLQEARIRLSKLIWWINQLQEANDIFEKEYIHNLYIETSQLLEKAKEIHHYFLYFIEKQNQTKAKQGSPLDHFKRMLTDVSYEEYVENDYDMTGEDYPFIHITFQDMDFVFDKHSGEFCSCKNKREKQVYEKRL